jgi:hypothetical protein
VLHRELFECVPFDPMVPRGEDGIISSTQDVWIQFFFGQHPVHQASAGAEVPSAVDALSRGYLPICLPAGENDGADGAGSMVFVHPEELTLSGDF